MRAGGFSTNLDLLRSIAIGAVLFDHVTRMLGYPYYGAVGRSGVLLFFVHTALVLMFSLERLDRHGPVVRAFYIQRFFRIYPLSLCCVAASLLFRIPMGPLQPGFEWLGWRWVAASVLLVQNVTLLPSVSGPMWSLPYEVQMYLALPAIYRLTQKRRPLFYLAVIWILAAISSLQLHRVYAHFFGPDYNDSLHSPAPWFVPCFLGGVCAFVLSKRKHLSLPWPLLAALFLAFIPLIYYFPFRHADWIGCTVLGCLLPQFRDLQVPWLRQASHLIAKYSYGIYLSHCPLLWLVFRKLPHWHPAVLWTIFAALLVVVPVALFHLLEDPMIRYGRNLARRFQESERSEVAAEAAA